MELVCHVRRNAYYDSVALMLVSEELRSLPDVLAAAVVMATDLNRQVLAEALLLTDEAKAAGPGDLVVAVRARSAEAARGALARAETVLGSRRGASGALPDVAPRSVTSAVRRAHAVHLAVISVPGPYAAAEAHQALSAGVHVFLFSDNVSLADEVDLKRRAATCELLMMGPECGTSIVNGVGLGFANRVRRGTIGLVGASGTGLQEVTSLIHRLGGGVSQAIGTGGRDLSGEVGGLTTLQALQWLGSDSATAVIVLVSKPPSDAVARRVLNAGEATGKPVVACLLGWAGTAPRAIHRAEFLEDAARAACAAAGITGQPLDGPPVAPGLARGLGVRGCFSGGTLCEEAATIVGGGGRNVFTDFGADVYTRGRPHPMIDPSLRNAAVVAAGSDPSVGVVLADVVLGDAVHPDPAGALGEAAVTAVAAATRAGRQLTVVAHVVGTDDDPQRLSIQEAKLREAGVITCPTNRRAARLARELVGVDR